MNKEPKKKQDEPPPPPTWTQTERDPETGELKSAGAGKTEEINEEHKP